MASLCVSSVLTKIIKTGYAALQLEYFFTAGPDEVRAWTIRVSAVIMTSFFFYHLVFWSINWWWIPKRFFCHRLLTHLFTLNHNHTELHVWEVCPNLYFGISKSTFELSVFCKVFAAFLDLNSLSLLKHLRCGWEYRSLEQDRNFLCIKGFMCFDIWVWSAFLSLFFFFFFTYSQYILWIFMFFYSFTFCPKGPQ